LLGGRVVKASLPCLCGLSLALLGAFAIGCDDSTTSSGAPAPDAAAPDATALDAATPDATAPDATAQDAAVHDAQSGDDSSMTADAADCGDGAPPDGALVDAPGDAPLDAPAEAAADASSDAPAAADASSDAPADADAADAPVDAPVDGGPFVCGSETCDPKKQYCEVAYMHTPGDAGPTIGCRSVDAGCSPPSCACLSGPIVPVPQCGCYESPRGEVTYTFCPP
jgi:hypothetical protein